MDYRNIITEVASGRALLLDVRTQMEWNKSHAKNALRLDVNDIIGGKTDELPKDKKIYLYCRTGSRAGLAAELLKSRGYDAQNIGGLVDWGKAGGQATND